MGEIGDHKEMLLSAAATTSISFPPKPSIAAEKYSIAIVQLESSSLREMETYE